MGTAEEVTVTRDLLYMGKQGSCTRTVAGITDPSGRQNICSWRAIAPATMITLAETELLLSLGFEELEAFRRLIRSRNRILTRLPIQLLMTFGTRLLTNSLKLLLLKELANKLNMRSRENMRVDKNEFNPMIQ